MNTRENPRMNRIELSKMARRVREFATVPWISSKETPATKEMYDGNSGSTHGDRNDRRPASMATRMFRSGDGIALCLMRDADLRGSETFRTPHSELDCHRFPSDSSWEKYARESGLSHSRGPKARQAIRPSREIRYVAGTGRTAYMIATDPSPSRRAGKDSFSSCTKGRTVLAPSWMSTARTTNPWPLNSRYRRSMPGISRRQGTHHVAKKFKKTIFPRKSASRTFRPLRSFRLKSGASTSSLGGCRPS